MPDLVSLADELKNLLAAVTYTPAVTWLRQYLPPEVYEDLATIGVVSPAPIGTEYESFTRGGAERSLVIRVGLASKVAQLDTAAIDARVSLIESIIDRARQNPTATYGTPSASAITQIWSEDGISQGVFQSLIEFTYTLY